jgi:hypothetical protein
LSAALIVGEDFDDARDALAAAEKNEEPEALALASNQKPCMINGTIPVEISAYVERDGEFVPVLLPAFLIVCLHRETPAGRGRAFGTPCEAGHD